MPPNHDRDYEELPYTNNAFPSSHPSTLATVAWLYGLTPPPIDTCRVLELGCGRGGNLLPMAEGLPGGRFVGIDLSPRQIAEANAHQAEVGLENIEYHAMDLCDMDDEIGNFDYIVAHGVYSWVPPQVQDRLLEVCAERLSKNGIAYISYNTFPGWHYRGVLRELLNQFVAREASAQDQVARSRELLRFLVDAMPDQTGIRTQLIAEESNALLSQADGYLFHDHLEENNRPCYFHEFVTHAKSHNLAFVAEAEINPLREGISPEKRQSISRWTSDNRTNHEQLLDFLTHRTFRRSILCHSDCEPQQTVQVERIRECNVVSLARPEAGAAIPPEGPTTFVTRANDSFTTNHPLVQTTLLLLHSYGNHGIAFHDLAERVAQKLNRSSDQDFEQQVAGVTMATYQRGAVQLTLEPWDFCSTVSAKPLAGAVARLQAKGDSRVTNREHRSIELDSVDRFLLEQMNGENDVADLEALLLRQIRTTNSDIDGGPTSQDETEQAAFAKTLVERRCQFLAQNGFLIR